MLLYLENTFVPDLVEFKHLRMFTTANLPLLIASNLLIPLIQIVEYLAYFC